MSADGFGVDRENRSRSGTRDPGSSDGVVVLTGASRGIGLGVAFRLARQGVPLVVVFRNSRRGRITARRIAREGTEGSVEWIPADLSSISEVLGLCERIREAHGRPRALVHNAAAVPRSRVETRDGFEVQWAVNYLAPFLITRCLPVASDPAHGPGRVISVSSNLHREGRINLGPALFANREYDPGRTYRDTKLANVLFSRSLSRRLGTDGCVSLAVNPGTAVTGLLQDLEGVGRLDRGLTRLLQRVRRTEPWGLDSCVDELARRCTVTVGVAENGGYFENGRLTAPGSMAMDEGLAEGLWEQTESCLRPWLG